MELYIGNATKQIVDFLYRIPESSGVRVQSIPIGGQIKLSGSLSRPAIDEVIRQHAKYGLVEAGAIDRSREFNGLCYSVDRPISAEKLTRVMRHNDAKLVERGRKLREEAAVAGSNLLETQLTESDRPERLRKMEMSVVEENHDDRDETPAIAEGVRVERTDADAGNAPGRRGARRRKQ